MTEPTPAQALILWCLLGRHGAAPQAEIVPAVRRADREALAAAGLVSVGKRGRALVLTVTDRGWLWAGGHLRAPLPPGARALGDWLARIDAHLTATGGTLAELIGPAPEPEAAPAAKPAAAEPARKPRARPAAKAPAPERKGRSRKPAPPDKGGRGAENLRERIEAAYLALTGGARATAVRLSALRAALPDLDRAAVDAALAAILAGDPTARLSQFSDPRALDAAEREAAYSPAGEPFHILWIQ